VIDGAFEVAYTPGHASHHVSYLHHETAFVGDVGGVRITPSGDPAAPTIPPTPPPDIDLEAWHESIARIEAWAPKRLAITHFGSYEDVERQLSALSSRLDSWAELARGQDRDAFIAAVNEEIERQAEPGMPAAYTQAAPPEQLYAGLERYLQKRAEAASAAGSPPVS
jgi:glyoxylase-like metal-dependent hydrolase (beta-lactamase superfamily II)